ncbi:MAG TPA: polysaccharide deacetylase family protein [Chloroflexota bacterium]|nr:polysaccharide deacetylase family protein [Chloroflexota bacterium]
MERVLTLVFLSLLLLVSVAAQKVVGPFSTPATSSLSATSNSAANSAAAQPNGDKGADSNKGGGEGAAAQGARAFPAESLVSDSRGLWLTDWSRGKVERVDRGPVPRQTALVPIFMYHNVRPIDFKTSNAFVSDLTLPPTEFELQLRQLKERGVSTVTMEDLYLYLEGRRDLPSRSVVLTFDDGFENNYLYAMPLLKRYGFVGTFYIISGLVGQNEYMTWREAQEMVSSGMEVGSHTVNHLDLARIPASARESQMVEAKRVLEERLGVSIRTLSYPSGAYNQDAVVAARKAGYVIAVTTQYGTVQDHRKIMELPRVRIHGTDQIAGFRSRLEQIFPSGAPATS